MLIFNLKHKQQTTVQRTTYLTAVASESGVEQYYRGVDIKKKYGQVMIAGAEDFDVGTDCT